MPRRTVSDIKEIIKQVRKFNQRLLLAEISSVAAGLNEAPGRSMELDYTIMYAGWPKTYHIVVSTHGLAILAKIVLANGNKWSRKTPSNRDIILLENQVQNLPTMLTSKPSEEITLEQFMFQEANKQFPIQNKSEKISLARSLELYRHIPAILIEEGFRPPFDLDVEFQKIAGMSIVQPIGSTLGFALFGSSLKGKPVTIKNIEMTMSVVRERWVGPSDDMPTEDTIFRFLKKVSLTPDEFNGLAGDLRQQPQDSISSYYRPLLEFPVVKTTSKEYIVPIPKLLIDRITVGIFHDFANAMKGTGRANSFRTYFGKLFERYVGLQLSLIFHVGDLTPERNYGKGGLATPDWVVDHHSQPLALECRSSTFSLETKIYAEPDGISDDLTRIGSVTLQELKRKIKALCNGETPIKLKSSNTPIPVICTYESLEPLGLFGSLLWKEVTASAGSDIGTFRIIPISYLEAMCSVSDEEIFLQALNALEVNADWTNPNGEHGEPEWRKAMPNPMPSNPILENVAENFLSFLPDDSVDK